MKTIDLRSDTVTQPGAPMRKAMATADLGDDVYGEDPTVNRLEALAAEMLGTEAAIFAPSGTQSNLLALLTHCHRGDEYIVGQNAHTYKYEGGGAAVLGSIQPQPLDFQDDGTLDLHKVARAIKPDDFHFARTRLLCLENTQAGRPLPIAYLRDAAALAASHGLNTHLDGARIFNAAVKLKVPADAIAQHFDSVSVCLSKGLGAPVGSLLCATAQQIAGARRWRKVLGGGMRQAGVLAAAGIYALQNNIDRLATDHANADLLAKELAAIKELQPPTMKQLSLDTTEELQPNPTSAQTNMVFVAVDDAAGLGGFLRDRRVLIAGGGDAGGATIRLVTHLDVTQDDVATVVAAFKQFFARR